MALPPSHPSTEATGHEDMCWYANRPWSFLFRYIKRRPVGHGVILGLIVLAVVFSVSTQYGVKSLVDALTQGPGKGDVWFALTLLCGLIAADNLTWRAAGFLASITFVAVTGDLRKDLFRHLTGHAPAYFADRPPGTIASRVTATSNAFFTIETMFIWNVLPPCVAAFASILLIGTVSMTMSAVLIAVFAVVIVAMFKIAAAGRPLHHDYADKAASVDGEIVDVVGNMSLVKSFGGITRERARFDDTLGREMTARRRSLFYLERLRLIHAVVTIGATIALLIWAVKLWQAGQATAGEVVLVCTLGLSILSATRDLAVALVDVTQHTARFSEALQTLLVPHRLSNHPAASELAPHGASIKFEDVSFAYAGVKGMFKDFNLEIGEGQWVGIIGPSGAGKSTMFSLLQRFYDIDSGRILIDGQDIRKVTQESLRRAITVVPQDISLFHRTLKENIRYGRPDATDEEVREAMEAAQCTDFIAEMPEGMETIVGDRGVKLSGGQRQRIAIARALLKNAPILLLDEATSALDTHSEAEVRAALANLMRGRTVLAIAHRLPTLANFDRIITINGGKVVSDTLAEGGHERVARMTGSPHTALHPVAAE
ncbi:ABC transporter ATP-binding protein [Enterovirga rhinocerotis]|uniref:ATP-binding cassette subfamily B protein n=1 Tax=Enterovirga rhinocerotis TaxID=1339210 RepID=A0A4R7BX14_9HYPH|nr:ABC transporter ATP-binding protein [Enterovirga rhinocerotis]TDR90460.1 ATP-binding cassette subfamily B protein [Enterovirga rhinocerotis]